MKIIKALTVSLIAFLFTTHSYGQSIVGTWQMNTNTVGSGLLENYVFKSDKTFEYRVNSEDGLQRIIAIGGTYTYKPGDLQLIVRYTKEVVGGTLERSHFLTGNDSWSIENGSVQKRMIAKPTTEYLELKFEGVKIITIDGNKFYKVPAS
jgi:hypothetical protein